MNTTPDEDPIQAVKERFSRILKEPKAEIAAASIFEFADQAIEDSPINARWEAALIEACVIAITKGRIPNDALDSVLSWVAAETEHIHGGNRAALLALLGEMSWHPIAETYPHRSLSSRHVLVHGQGSEAELSPTRGGLRPLPNTEKDAYALAVASVLSEMRKDIEEMRQDIKCTRDYLVNKSL